MGQSTSYLRMSGTERLTVQQAAAVEHAILLGLQMWRRTHGTQSDLSFMEGLMWRGLRKIQRAHDVAHRRDPGVVGPGANRKKVV